MNLKAIAHHFDESRPAISQHIKILNECRLVEIRKQGGERYCDVRRVPLREVSDWIEPFRRLWTERFDALDLLLKDLKEKKKGQAAGRKKAA